MASDASKVAETAYMAYLEEKGFAPKNATQLLTFSKCHNPPFIGVNYKSLSLVIKHPPNQPNNPYLDDELTQNFISPNIEKQFIEKHQETPKQCNIAAACDLYKDKKGFYPTNPSKLLSFCKWNNLHITYSQCLEYLSSKNKHQKQKSMQKDNNNSSSELNKILKARKNSKYDVNKLKKFETKNSGKKHEKTISDKIDYSGRDYIGDLEKTIVVEKKENETDEIDYSGRGHIGDLETVIVQQNIKEDGTIDYNGRNDLINLEKRIEIKPKEQDKIDYNGRNEIVNLEKPIISEKKQNETDEIDYSGRDHIGNLEKPIISEQKQNETDFIDYSGRNCIGDLEKKILSSNKNENDLILTHGIYNIEEKIKMNKINWKKISNALSELNDEKCELVQYLDSAKVVQVQNNETIRNNLKTYLEEMHIKNKINVQSPEEIRLTHSYHDDRYNIKITPISPDPVMSVHLNMSYNLWNINKQNEFIKDFALELDINPAQLIPICVSSGSVTFIVQICNVIKDKFPLIEKKCITLNDNTNKICKKWKLKASKLKNWASNKLGFTKPQNVEIIENENITNDSNSKLNTAEKWLLNQAESLREQIVESLQECPHEFEISGICALDNDKCLEQFIHIDGWQDSKLLFHGTKLRNLSSLYKNGFDDKFIGSATDPGWYGRGHYFTSFPQYSMPYCEANEFGQRTLIVSYVNVGKTYQVYDSETYYGEALENGYQSHYVKVTEGGGAISKEEIDNYEGDIFDEYVVETGKRVLPRFCVTFTKKKNVLVWRDAKLGNDENRAIMDKLRKSNVIYGALTTEEAVKIIKKKKSGNMIYVITNGNDNSDDFINIIRNELNISNPIMVFTMTMEKYKYLSDKYADVTVTVSTSDLYDFVKKYTENKFERTDYETKISQNNDDMLQAITTNDIEENKNDIDVNIETMHWLNDNNEFFDDDDDENYEGAIVIDNGSGMIKAGFAGDNAPQCVFPSIVGRPRHQGVMSGMGQKDAYVGDEAIAKRGILSLKYPIEHGIITNYDDMETIWRHTFDNELGVDPECHPVLITDHLLNPKLQKEKITQIMFETFNTKLYYLADCNTLALYGTLYGSSKTKSLTGCIVDCGHSVTNIASFCDGIKVPHSTMRLDIGGDDITTYLSQMLQQQDVDSLRYLPHSTYLNICQDIKERLCYIVVDYEHHNPESMVHFKNYELPDGQIIEVSTELYECTEALFNPSLVGVDTNGPLYKYGYLFQSEGIDSLIYKSISRCNTAELCQNILLVGGSSMIEGLADRIEKELQDKKYSVKVTATDPSRKYSTWIGGSIIASLPQFQNQWITKHEYDEEGPRCILRKCGDNRGSDFQ